MGKGDQIIMSEYHRIKQENKLTQLENRLNELTRNLSKLSKDIRNQDKLISLQEKFNLEHRSSIDKILKNFEDIEKQDEVKKND